MKRRSFFGSLLATLSLSAVVKAKPSSKKKNSKDFRRRYPFIDREAFKKNPFEADGVLSASGNVLTIMSPSNVAVIGDIIITTVGPRLLIIGVSKHEHDFLYRCVEIEKPKTICGIPVIMINGKYMRYAKINAVKLNFMTIMSPFKESSI